MAEFALPKHSRIQKGRHFPAPAGANSFAVSPECGSNAKPQTTSRSKPAPRIASFAATLIASLLQKHRWIAYIGLALIFYVALKMIYEGGEDVLHAMGAI